MLILSDNFPVSRKRQDDQAAATAFRIGYLPNRDRAPIRSTIGGVTEAYPDREANSGWRDSRSNDRGDRQQEHDGRRSGDSYHIRDLELRSVTQWKKRQRTQ